MPTTDRNPSTTIGAGVAYGRYLRGWIGDDLAAAMREETGDPSWNKRKISRIEGGNYQPRWYELRALSRVLNLPMSFLTDGVIDLEGGGSPRSQKGWYADTPMSPMPHPDSGPLPLAA